MIKKFVYIGVQTSFLFGRVFSFSRKQIVSFIFQQDDVVLAAEGAMPGGIIPFAPLSPALLTEDGGFLLFETGGGILLLEDQF